jgi:hypothetical protein
MRYSTVHACRLFGAALDKTEQVSDWSARPLRQSQLQYAANDAHILVAMADLIVSSAPAPPNLGSLWALQCGRHLLQTMYPKPGGLDEDMFVFGDEHGDAEAQWLEWRHRVWGIRR